MKYDNDEAIKRMIQVVGVKTQADLGVVLGVSQASVSDAKRKGKIPPEWLVKLAEERDVNPNWIKTGGGPMKIGQAPAQAQSVAENNSKYITGHDPATSAILNTALDVLAASPDLAKTLTAIITTLGKAAEDAANVKRLTKSLPHLEEYDPDLSSSHRLVFDWMKSLDEFALQLLITELQSRDNFKRWLEKRHDERERKRA